LNESARVVLRRFPSLGGDLMKKIFFFACFLVIVLVLSMMQTAYGDSSEGLQLNEEMITNSDAGVGGAGDFPIRNQLFSPEMKLAVKKEKGASEKRMQKTVKEMDFKTVVLHAHYRTDTSKVEKQLFVDYRPAALNTGGMKMKKKNNFWYIFIVAIGLPLAFGAACLGRWSAGRRRRKNG
jgi:type VII secretion protein EssA